MAEEPREKRWREFAKAHGHPHPPGATPQECWDIRNFWAQELEVCVDARGQLMREKARLELKTAEVEDAIKRSRHMLDAAGFEIVQQITRNMSPDMVAKIKTAPPMEDEDD